MATEQKYTNPISIEKTQRWHETATILQKTRFVEYRNPYVSFIQQQEGNGVSLEELARQNRGAWRKSTFGANDDVPLDLEIGTGNGEFLLHQSITAPTRLLLGIERKFKPLAQSLKRLQRNQRQNAALVRYQAELLEEIFAPQELNNIYLFFPDPWPKQKHQKNRLMSVDFLKSTFALQKSGSFLEIKTDSDSYFQWMLECARKSTFAIERETADLHNSPWNEANFMTQFERLWTEKGLTTKYLRLKREYLDS